MGPIGSLELCDPLDVQPRHRVGVLSKDPQKGHARLAGQASVFGGVGDDRRGVGPTMAEPRPLDLDIVPQHVDVHSTCGIGSLHHPPGEVDRGDRRIDEHPVAGLQTQAHFHDDLGVRLQHVT